MEKITDVACVKNEIYKDSIYNLSKILVLKMSETFDEQQYEIYIHDDFAEVVWLTKMQVMAEDLTDSLEKKLGAHILFASSEENGRIIKVEAYSTPVENSMYAIYLSSDQHGVIDSITVFFFDSLDVMYHHLRKDYQSITKVVGDIIEKQSLQDLAGIFI